MVHFSYKNGLELLVHRDTKLKNSVLNVLYKVGSAQEQSNQTGLAHFLEHMMFEGSRNFPDFDRSLQGMMAENNAFTGQDYTCYYETFPHKHLQSILKIEMDRMHHLSIKKSAVQIQTNVIVEEFKETSLNPPMADAWDHLLKLCFTNSYQWQVIGKNLKHLTSIDKKALVDFYKNNYTSHNAILSIVSASDEKDIAAEVCRVFKSKIIVETKFTIPQKSIVSGKRIGTKRLKRNNIAVPNFFMAFHIEDYATKGYLLSDMVSDLLTNGESSLLYKALVLNAKLCTEIQSYTTDNIHCNLLVIEGKLAMTSRFEDVYDKIKEVFVAVKSKKLSSARFETLYNKALSYWSFYHYNSAQLAQNMAIFYHAAQVIHLPKFIDDMYHTITKKELETHLCQLLDFDQASLLEYAPGNSEI
ncbi:MAG: M16 family metallopeptidase [Chitinophagales bacterium]|jgi:zinc protease|nr:insulinase family protein [Sphingobacteriales bacterium]